MEAVGGGWRRLEARPDVLKMVHQIRHWPLQHACEEEQPCSDVRSAARARPCWMDPVNAGIDTLSIVVEVLEELTMPKAV